MEAEIGEFLTGLGVNKSIYLEVKNMAKKLIAYFSRKGNNYANGSIKNLSVGNTEVAAKMIQELTGIAIHGADVSRTKGDIEKWV